MVRPWFVMALSAAILAALVALLWLSTRPNPQQREQALTLFCTHGYLKPVRDICADYEKEFGVKVGIEPDSSGALLSKLRVAPERVDLFLSAEKSFMNQAQELHLVSETIPVARQHVVIAVAADNPKKIAAFDDLFRADLRVVLPNPELTAAARTAKRAISGDRWQRLLARRQGEGAQLATVGNVNEAAQAVKIAAADATLIWDATAREFGLAVVEVPEFQSGAVETAIIGVVSASPRPTPALHFARYMTARDRGEIRLKEHFFEPLADADVWADRPRIRLMAGAMLKPGVEELVKAFSEREGVAIDTVYAGCGLHVAQMKAIKAGEAPAAAHFPDAYFACDVSFMSKVQTWFEPSTTITRNDIVLVVPKGNPKKVASIRDLANPELRIGLAHPKNSALGALVDDMLNKLELHDKVYSPARTQPIVHADAGHVLVNQMRAGALDLIVVYQSNVQSNPENAEKYLDTLPLNLPEAVARQPYAVANDSDHRQLMRRFLDAILSPGSRDRFERAGFQWIAPEGAK